MNHLYKISLLAVILLALSSCAVYRGVYHKVGKGETLWRISYTYKVDIQDVAEVNNIKNPTKIRAGQRIFIPGASSVKKVVPFKKPPPSYKKPRRVVAKVEKGRFIWPIKGKVISKFGMRGDSMHYGVDIKAARGTVVRASEAGRIVYSGSGMRGFGNVIIMEHKGGFFTVYSHNDKNTVKKGKALKRGEPIALVGDSGNATTVHLHFEVRDGKKKRNPLFFLP